MNAAIQQIDDGLAVAVQAAADADRHWRRCVVCGALQCRSARRSDAVVANTR